MLLEATHCLAHAAGCSGMIEGRWWTWHRKAGGCHSTCSNISTAALIGAAITIGGLLGGGSAVQLEALKRYGQAIGLAFQIADDVPDVEGDSAALGKRVGQDA